MLETFSIRKLVFRRRPRAVTFCFPLSWLMTSQLNDVTKFLQPRFEGPFSLSRFIPQTMESFLIANQKRKKKRKQRHELTKRRMRKSGKHAKRSRDDSDE